MRTLEQFRHQHAVYHQWLWRSPSPEEPRLLRALRATLRIILVYWHEFWRDAILLRASALTFTVVLSLVPVLALSTSVLKGLGAGDQMREAAYQFIETFESGPTQEAPPLPLPSDKESPAEKEAQEQTSQTFTSHLKRAVDTIFDYVERTNFATLGIIGVTGLFITVISVLATIEDAMNVVWDAKSGRPLGRKIMDYLALMLLLPLAVNIGMGAMAALQSPSSAALIRRLFPVSWTGPLLINLLTLTFLTAVLTILYRFLPNTKVGFRPAVIGGLAGAVFWLLIQALYLRLQIGVSRYNAIYGSFATLPLFLLWIYTSWVVFLSGAEVAFAANVWKYYSPRESRLAPSVRLALALDLLAAVYQDFRTRQPTQLAALADRLGYSELEVESVTEELLNAGYLREVNSRADGLVPATGAEMLRASELLENMWGTVSLPSAGSRLAGQALEGAKAALADQTLQELMTDAPPPSEQEGA